MKRMGILLAALMVAGCQDQTMTGVEKRALSASPRFTVESVESDNTRFALDDVMTRIVPALSDANAAQGLVAAFRGLQQAMSSGNAAAAPGLVRAAQAALDHYVETARTSAPDVDAMRLALGTVSL